MNNHSKTTKLLAMFLAFLLVIIGMPLSPFVQAIELAPGEVYVDKHRSNYELDPGESTNVTLTVQTEGFVSTPPKDVVITIDISNSMVNNHVMTPTIDAANALADMILNDGSGSRLALVRYGDYASVYNFTTGAWVVLNSTGTIEGLSGNDIYTSSYSAAETSINNIRSNLSSGHVVLNTLDDWPGSTDTDQGGTTTEAGIYVATVVAGKASNSSYSIFMSDGVPTSRQIGQDKSANGLYGITRDGNGAATSSDEKSEAIAKTASLKAATTSFAVAVTLGMTGTNLTNAREVMGSVADGTEKYYETNDPTADITSIYTSIGSTIINTIAQNAYVTDIVPACFDVSNLPAGVTAVSNPDGTTTLTWAIGNLVEGTINMSYTLTLKQGYYGIINTNESAVLYYDYIDEMTDPNTLADRTFPLPEIKAQPHANDDNYIAPNNYDPYLIDGVVVDSILDNDVNFLVDNAPYDTRPGSDLTPVADRVVQPYEIIIIDPLVAGEGAISDFDPITGTFTYTPDPTRPPDAGKNTYSVDFTYQLVTIDASGAYQSNIATVTITCPVPVVGTLKINKVLYDYEGNPVATPRDFTFKLTGGDLGPSGMTIVVTTGTERVVPNLTFGTYTLTEVDPGDDYYTTITPQSFELSQMNTLVTVTASNTEKRYALAIDKSATESSFDSVGNIIHYTILVDNNGNTSLTGITVSDPLLTNEAPTVGIDGYNIGDTDKDNELDPTETWTYTGSYTITQDNLDAGKVDNTATADSADTDPVNDSVRVTGVKNPLLTIDKTGSFAAGADGFADVGELITYTFTVSNIGNVTLTDVTVTDPLTGLGAITRISGDTNFDNKLQVTETWVYSATYAVTQTDIDAGSVYNQATADSHESGPDTDDNIEALTQDPKINIVKEGSFAAGADGFADVGELITYTFTVTNTGNVTLTDLTVTDPLTGLGAITRISGDTNFDNKLQVTETWVYSATYAVTQTDIDAGSVYNLATADTDESEPDTDDNIEALTQDPKINIVKEGSFAAGADGFADVGELITYTFTVSNIGNVTLTDVTVTDPLTGLGAITRISGDTNFDNKLQVTETWVYSATYAVTQTDIDAGSVYNLATADSDESEPDTDDNTETLPQDPKINIVKEGSFAAGADGFADVGELITYTFTVSNIGNVTLTDVTVTDPLTGLGAITRISGDTNFDNKLQVTETWVYSATYAVTQTDIDAGSVYNQATADSHESGPDTDDNIEALTQDPKINIVKEGSFAAGADGFADVGELITYTFTVTNTGNMTLTDVTVTDPLTGLGAITRISGDTNFDNKLQITETWVYSATYAVTQTNIDAGSVYNLATADSDESEPDTDDNTETLPQDPKINIIKEGSFAAGADGFADVGELITYTFTVTNTGNMTLTDLTVTDPLTGLGAITRISGDTNFDNKLQITETWVYTGTYAVTQDDIDAGSVYNLATADSDESEPDTDDNTEPLAQSAEINIDKTGTFGAGADGLADVGELITYTFAVTNTGNVSLSNVVVTDTKAGISVVPNLGADLIHNIGDLDNDGKLDVGEAWTYTGTYAVTQADIDAGSVYNLATADSDESEEDTDDNTEILPQDPALSLDKTGTFGAGADGLADVGELITYTFTVTNTGNVTLTDISVTDPKVSNIAYVSGDTNTNSKLDVGEAWTYTGTYAVTQADIDAGSVYNLATADSDESEEDTDDNTEDLPQDPALSLDKTGTFGAGADGLADVGELITYTFTVTNTGNMTLTDISVTDPKVSNIAYVSGDTNTNSKLDVGEAWSYTGTYAVTQTDIDAGSVYNLATADSDESEEDTDDNTETLPQDPALSLDKTGTFGAGADNLAAVGELITYTFVVTNTGNMTLTDISVTDPKVSNIAYVSGDTNTNSKLDVGEAWSYTGTYAVTQDDIDAGSVYNLATADSDESEPDTDDNTEPLAQSAEINIDKTGTFGAGADGLADVGELITYTFAVTNTGNVSLSNVVVTDTKAGISVVPNLGADLIHNIGDLDNDGKLDVGEAWTYTGTYAVTQADIDAGSVYNLATADSDESEEDTDDNTEILPQDPALSLDKTGTFGAGADGLADVGELITYTFTVTNTGNVTLTDISVTDPKVSNIAYVSGDTNTNSKLDVGEAWTYTGTYAVTQADIDAGSVYNLATADSDESEEDTDDNTEDLPQDPALSLDKTGTFGAGADGLADVGELITYTFTVTNTGNMTLTDISVTDPMVSNIAYVSGDTNTNSKLDVGEVWTYTGTYAVTQTDIDAGSVYNLAAADSDESEEDTDDNTETLPQDPALSLDKTGTFGAGADGLADVGELITYTFTVTNTGNMTLTDISVTDPKVSNIAYVSGDTNTNSKLDVGEAWSYTGTYAVTQTDIDAGSVYNLATADSDESEEDTDDNTETLPQDPKINIVKTGTYDIGEDGYADVGELITYTFDVTNTGNMTLTNISVTDSRVSNIAFVSGDTNDDDKLQVGEVWVYSATYAVTQDDIDAGSVYNLATADSDESDDVADDDIELLTQDPKLMISKLVANLTRNGIPADLSELYVGETARFKVIITNDGNITLTNVIFTDNQATVGSEVTNVTAGTTLTWTSGINGIATMQLGDLAVGESIELTYDYLVVAGDVARETITNTATAVGTVEPTDQKPDGSTLSVNDSATIIVEEIPLARSGISINKLVENVSLNGTPADLATGFAGNIFRYTVNISNTGSLKLVQITLTDNRAAVGSIARNVTAGTNLVWMSGTGGIATLTIDSLPAGASITIAYNYTSTSSDIGFVKVNTAIVKSVVEITLDDPEVVIISAQDNASISVDQIPLTGESDYNRILGLALLIMAAALILFRKRHLSKR